MLLHRFKNGTAAIQNLLVTGTASFAAGSIPTSAINGYSSGGSSSLPTTISATLTSTQIGYTVWGANGISGTINGSTVTTFETLQL